ncbi:uncharacterized protein LOC134773343 [Penaeus indicus]|uniref:uncharacterized protein LOC134773343 n=1 Tax=Penaeus indicus TaxID=29960 RepID=UPI00300CC8A8
MFTTPTTPTPADQPKARCDHYTAKSPAQHTAAHVLSSLGDHPNYTTRPRETFVSVRTATPPSPRNRHKPSPDHSKHPLKPPSPLPTPSTLTFNSHPRPSTSPRTSVNGAPPGAP